MRRASALTTKVTTNSTRPVAISRLTSRPDDSGNFRAMFDGDRVRVLGADDVERDDVGGRQDDGDGHRLAERSTEAEHGAADHAGAPVRNDRLADHLPASSLRGRATPPRAGAGVCRNTSREMAVMIGRIMTASTAAAVIIVRPLAAAGPVEEREEARGCPRATGTRCGRGPAPSRRCPRCRTRRSGSRRAGR